MAYIVIPTRVDNVDLNSASDVNQLMANDAYLKTEIESIATTNGSGAPSSTPTKIGNRYIDTTSGSDYFAIGTSSSSDWILQSQAPKIGMMMTANWADVTFSKDYVGATRYMAYQTGYITTMAMWINNNTNGGKAKCAIYANHTDSSRPSGAPLAVSNEVTLDGIPMKIWLFNFPTPYKITKGTNYWLAFNFGTYDASPMRLGTTAIVMCQYWSQLYSSGNSFLTISVTGTNDYCMSMFAY